MDSNKTSLNKILWRFKNEYISLLVFSLVINVLMLTPSFYMLQVYDRVLSSRDDNTLIGLSLISLYIYVVYALLERVRGQVLVDLAEQLDAIVSPLIHSKIINSSNSNKTGELSSIQDLSAVKQFITGQPILSLLDAPWFFVYLLYIIFVSIFIVQTRRTNLRKILLYE
jgi:ABC-type protease/lipase transport system fused ATPase/permease subunit